MKNYYGKYHLTNYGSGSIPTDPKAAKKLDEAYDYSYKSEKKK
tara:strand:- start:5066 stop:5194 length:129 start_codon:yes stop_codon:yes gene_type:complete